MSSSPEQQDFIGLHIRSVGTWTNKLYDFFNEKNNLLITNNNFQDETSRLESLGGTNAIPIENSSRDVVTVESNSSIMDRSNNRLEVWHLSL